MRREGHSGIERIISRHHIKTDAVEQIAPCYLTKNVVNERIETSSKQRCGRSTIVRGRFDFYVG